ncbi:MAG: hypothetical protein O6942_07925 [Bacteroidetes bacterium]|nr:hypothetical protein [Bacteroidota bacterium]
MKSKIRLASGLLVIIDASTFRTLAIRSRGGRCVLYQSVAEPSLEIHV